jgi:hypothetical protein
MKKVLTALMALTMVFGFAAMASADPCANCAGLAGTIERGCLTGQTPTCESFDFENINDYNDCGQKIPNRALFRICDCIESGDFETVVTNDVIEVTMEILVDKGAGKVAGDNGVYWAQNVDGGIGLGLYDDQDAACYIYGSTNPPSITGNNSSYPASLRGMYDYYTAAGALGTPLEGSAVCTVPATNRVVKLVPTKGQALGTFGYKILSSDEVNGNATWAIDIPKMRVDNSMVNKGDKVWVKICLLRDCSGLCNADEICCCYIYIGDLCCVPETNLTGKALLFPYMPKADSTYYNVNAITVANTSDAAGAMTITMYESDGDVGTVTISSVAAHGIEVLPLSALVDDMTSSGTLGDAANGCYIVVTPVFEASGFAFIGNTTNGTSMGYLAEHK